MGRSSNSCLGQIIGLPIKLGCSERETQGIQWSIGNHLFQVLLTIAQQVRFHSFIRPFHAGSYWQIVEIWPRRPQRRQRVNFRLQRLRLWRDSRPQWGQ